MTDGIYMMESCIELFVKSLQMNNVISLDSGGSQQFQWDFFDLFNYSHLL